MSKIMRELYAQARAAREAAELAAESQGSEATPPAAPEPAAQSSVDWWIAQYGQFGEALVRRVALEANASNRLFAVETVC